MAYTYVPPRQTSASPALTGATMVLKYLNDFNAKKQEQMQARMDNIFKMADSLDYFSTVSAENKRMQTELYKNLVDGLTKITEDYTDRNGVISYDGRLQKQLLFREASAQIAKLQQKEQEFFKNQEEFAKNPDKYEPEDWTKYSALYYTTADN